MDNGPLFNKDGSIAVDPKKYPLLYARLQAGQAWREDWKKVRELRLIGRHDAADRLAHKLICRAYGIRGPEMDEETKEKLRQYNEAHKDEIRERRRQKREVEKRLKERLAPRKGRATSQVTRSRT